MGANNKIFSAKLFRESLRPTRRFPTGENERSIKDYRMPPCLDRPHQKYEINGEIVPSVTSIIHLLGKEELIKWANSIGKLGIDSDIELEKASIIGSAFHLYVENNMFKHDPNKEQDFNEILGCSNSSMVDKINMTIESFIKWFDKNPSFTVLESELSLVSTEYSYGGTIDSVIKLNDDLYILDYKTSKDFYYTHFIQLAAYNQLLLENTDYRVKGAIVLKLDKNKGNTAKSMMLEAKELELYFNLFETLLKSYSALKAVENNWSVIKERIQ